MLENARRNRLQSRIIPHHSATVTIVYFYTENLELIDHPLLDLVPNDFFLFPETKDKSMKCVVIMSEETIQENQLNLRLKEMLMSAAWHFSFTKWYERMIKCVKVKEKYFKKM